MRFKALFLGVTLCCIFKLATKRQAFTTRFVPRAQTSRSILNTNSTLN